MQRSSPVKNICSQILRQYHNQIQTFKTQPSCDIFISHRGIDTKKNVAGLLYDYMSALQLRPFLDSKSMKPGDKLFEKIDPAIRNCKIGIAVFSPRYCESYFCLHELSLIMESKKKFIPIFCDVKPSELRVNNLHNGVYVDKELRRFNWALEEAKYTVGLTFDSSKGDWSKFLFSAVDAVVKNLLEVEEERQGQNQNIL